MLLANNPQICFDYPMRAGEVSYRAHAAGPCPDLTNDLRSPVSNRVKHTGRPELPTRVGIHAHKKTTRRKRRSTHSTTLNNPPSTLN